METRMIRHLESRDYDIVSPVIDEWWGGRPVRGLLPRLFFEHFRPTSFAVGPVGVVQGFLVGFQSQTDPCIAYIHFVGVSPTLRHQGMGRDLYERFFATVAPLGCTEVRCITSPVNTGSIAFHRRMGFALNAGTGEVDGIPVVLNYAGEGQARVLFSKRL